MSYGNRAIQSIADERAWYTKFIEYITYLLGFNVIEDLSSLETPPTAPSL